MLVFKLHPTRIMYDYGALLWFLFSCLIIRGAYNVVRIGMCLASRRYSRQPRHRQLYVAKNLIKACYLAILAVVAAWLVVVPIVVDDVWNTFIIHRLAVLYVSNDFMGLVLVDRLPSTTKIHHVVTTVLVFTSLSLDFQTSDIAQAMLVYTYGASCAYAVNAYLGLRVVWSLPNIRKKAGVTYLVCLVVTWWWQLRWVWSRPEWGVRHLLYGVCIGFIVRDDIILLRWLLHDV